MNKLGIYLLLIFLGLTIEVYGQQEAQYTQYMYNTISINPAYAGSRGALSITGLHRSQWVGLEGAPRTQTLNLHSPIGYSGKVGLGVSIIHDQIGPTYETNFDIDFSYTINTSAEGKLAFGLKAGGHLLDVDYTKLRPYVPADRALGENIDNKFSPNVGAGLYYHHADRWYLGISAPNLLRTDHFENEQISVAEERIHYYLIGGYVFDLSPDVKLKPAALLKAVSGAPLSLDVSANVLFSEKFRIGAAWRWDAAWSALAGFQVSDQLMIGMAYDKETTDLGNTSFNDGSYEVFIRFELFKNQDRIISPRFF